MARQTVIANVVIQLENSLQPPQFGAALVLSQFTMLVGADGKPTTTPAFSPIPVDADDMTDDLVAAMNEQLGRVGLFIGRLGTASTAQDGE